MFNLGAIPLPLLGAMILGFAVLLITGVARLRWNLLLLGLMFFVGTISVATTPWGAPIQQWLYPFQANRSALFLTMGGMLALVILANMSDVSARRISLQGLLLLAIAVYAGSLRLLHEGPGSGASSILFAVVTIGPLIYLIPGLLNRWGDYFAVLRTLSFANAFWLFAVGLQFLLNASAMSKGRADRFFGLLGNAQHAAVYLGVMGAIALWLLLNDPNRRYRLIWVALTVVNVGLLLWTGSRTGTAMFLMGAVVSAYGRLGRTVLLLPVFIVLGWAGVGIATMLGFDWGTAERLTSLEDTRSAAWMNMIASGMSSPLIGVGIESAGDSENSYLYAFAAYGIGMVTLIIALIIVSVSTCWRLFVLRRVLDPDRRALVDLVLGYNVMYFSGAMLEGYLMSRVSGSLVLMLIFSAFGTHLLEHGLEFAEEHEGEYDDAHEYEDDYAEFIDEEVAAGYGHEGLVGG